jgi:hypothetical protein
MLVTFDPRSGGFVHNSPSNSHEEEVFGIALLLSDWQGGQMGRRRLIPWSRLMVRVNSEKLGITLGVRFVDSYYSSDRGDCFNDTMVGHLRVRMGQ